VASPTKKRKKPAPRRWILADVLLTLGMVLERASHAGAMTLGMVLERASHAGATTTDAAHALRQAAETDFHFALVDYRLSNYTKEGPESDIHPLNWRYAQCQAASRAS